ncbi:MAG: FecR domain-containing protein [Moraxellaceae bacterium]|nr:FecR domain-containing protein [Moraxellaceae bacterium]
MLSKRVLFPQKTIILLSFMFGSNAIVWADIAGRVSFVEGQASVINNSTKRSVFKGDIIHTGEQIETLKETTVQIRMIDDSVVALHPESLFEITQYNFNKNQPQSSDAILTLIRGQLRIISGVIGQTQDSYLLTTPVGTLKTYDADYSNLLDENGLTVSVTRGSVSFGNTKFSAGETFDISKDSPPILSTKTISLSSLMEKLITQPKIMALNTMGGDNERPRLEDFSSYNKFLQAMYLYRKIAEETAKPKIIINNLPNGQTVFEYSVIDGTHEIINWGENITQILPLNNANTAPASLTNTENKIQLKMNLLNIEEMENSSIDESLNQPQFLLSDILDLEDKDLSSLLNWEIYDDFEEKKKKDELLSRLVKKGIKTDAVGTDIMILGTDIGQSEIMVINRPSK